MSAPTIPYTFTDGTIAYSAQVNANFTALLNAITTSSNTLTVGTITASFFNSASSNIAGGAAINLANTDVIAWRNHLNSANINLSVDSSNRFNFATNFLIDTSGNASLSGSITFLTSGDGLVGTTTNDSASTGIVGEYLSNTGSGNTPATSTFGDAATISLTAGDWDVSGIISYSLSGATCTAVTGGISTTSGNHNTGLSYGDTELDGPPPTAAYASSITIVAHRMSVSTTTSVYLKMFAVFSAGQPTYAARLSARRVR